MKAKEIQELLIKYQILLYLDIDKLEKFRSEFYPTADSVNIQTYSEYNDEGYSAALKFDFCSYGNKLDELEFGEDYKKGDDYYDKRYSIVKRLDIGQEFSCPVMHYDFTTGEAS